MSKPVKYLKLGSIYVPLYVYYNSEFTIEEAPEFSLASLAGIDVSQFSLYSYNPQEDSFSIAGESKWTLMYDLLSSGLQWEKASNSNYPVIGPTKFENLPDRDTVNNIGPVQILGGSYPTRRTFSFISSAPGSAYIFAYTNYVTSSQISLAYVTELGAKVSSHVTLQYLYYFTDGLKNFYNITYGNYEQYLMTYDPEWIGKAQSMTWMSPEGDITVSRGDTIENIFSLLPYPIGSEPIEPFTDVKIGFTSITDKDDTFQESLGPLFLDIQGTSVTIGERMYLNKFKLVAVANGYVYGPTENPIHPEGDPVKITKIVTVTDPWDRTYGEGGESSGGGGNGSHSGPGGTISGGGAPSYSTRGDLPTGSAEADSSNTGLFTRYALGSAGLRGIAAALYADTILQNIGKEVMSFLWNSPSDGLISLVSYPFSVTSLPNVNSSSVSKMKFGSLELPISSTRLGSTFSQIEWGTITLDEYWGNFLDYAPHTKIDLYLPWCTGSVSLDPHECLPGSIEVVTNVELAKGTCCHSIFGNKGALIGTYYGTCGSVLPLTAIDTSGKALALVTAAAGVMSAVGNAGAATTAGIAAANSPETSARAYGLELSRGLDPMSARVLAQRDAIQAAEAPYRAAQNRGIKVAAPSAIAAFRTPANVVRNGSFVANGPGMAMQFPFIILSRPEQNIPSNYAGHYGYPSNVLASLGSVSGYTEVAAIHLDGISGATMNEIEEIDALLKGGVIL